MRSKKLRVPETPCDSTFDGCAESHARSGQRRKGGLGPLCNLYNAAGLPAAPFSSDTFFVKSDRDRQQ